MTNDAQDLEKGNDSHKDAQEGPTSREMDGESHHTRNTSSMDTIEEMTAEEDEEELEQVRPTKSRSSSTRSRTVTTVPRSKRRGLFARFALIGEVENPYYYKRSTKWLVTLIIALAAAAAPMGSAIFYPSLVEISKDFNTTSTITNLSVAMYMLSMAIFPLWWSSFSETFGRRTIYLVSFTIFVIFNILSAVSTSIGMLIVMRIFGGGAAASVQAVGAGTIADIWEVRERGKAMGIFYLGPLCGPLLAPVVGGAIAESLGWRSTQWFLAIYGGLCVLMIFFCLPETLRAKHSTTVMLPPNTAQVDEKANEMTRVSTTQSLQLKSKRIATVLKQCLIEPLYVLGYLRFPAVTLVIYWAAITFGALYVLNVALQQTFSSSPYSYKTVIIGCFYIPGSLGYFAAAVIGGRWNDYIMHREARKANRISPTTGKLLFIPEDRMRENVYLSAAVYPAALLVFGWTTREGIIWIVPLIANFFFGAGTMIIFGCATTMLTEFMPKKSSSGVALNNFIRNIFACVGGVVASPLIDAIGNGWLFTGLAVICGLSGLGSILAMRKWSVKWRTQMDLKLNTA